MDREQTVGQGVALLGVQNLAEVQPESLGVSREAAAASQRAADLGEVVLVLN